MSADVRKFPGLHKTGDVTLKRGVVGVAKDEDQSLKKLPGKTNPPTLVLKRGKNQSVEAAAPLKGKKR